MQEELEREARSLETQKAELAKRMAAAGGKQGVINVRCKIDTSHVYISSISLIYISHLYLSYIYLSRVYLSYSLMWTNADKPCDLDLNIDTPSGLLNYQQTTQGNGTLDVDKRGEKGDMVENVFWSKPDAGKFRVFVTNYTEDVAMPFSVVLKSEHSITLMDPNGVVTARNFVGFKAFPGECKKGTEQTMFRFEVSA